MIRWMRKIAPYDRKVWIPFIAFIVVFFLLEIAKWVILLAFSMDDTASEIKEFQTFLLGIFAVLCGVFRACFHPASNREYYTWLSKTPWRLGKPLPLGPAHLVLQDLVVLALIEGLWAYTSVLPLAVPMLLFFLSYSIVLSFVIEFTGDEGCALCFFFGLGCVVYALPSLLAALGVAVVIYALMQVALRRNLAKFPWDNKLDWDKLEVLANRKTAQRTAPSISWPFDALMPTVKKADNPFLVSIVVGWWAFQLEWFEIIGNDFTPATEIELFRNIMLVAFGALAILFTGLRLYRYLPGHRAPINIFGRIATGRIIIPGYDKVFVAPICALLTMYFLPPCLEMLSISFFGAQSIALGVAVFITQKMGPTREEWDLTGDYRMVPPMLTSNEAIYKRI